MVATNIVCSDRCCRRLPALSGDELVDKPQRPDPPGHAEHDANRYTITIASRFVDANTLNSIHCALGAPPKPGDAIERHQASVVKFRAAVILVRSGGVRVC